MPQSPRHPITSLPLPDQLSVEYLEFHLVLPVALEDGQLRLAVVRDPPAYVLEDLREVFGAPVVPVAEEEPAVRDAIRRLKAARESVIEIVDQPGPLDGTEGGATADVRDQANQPPVVRWVNILIRDAADAGASDIHLDATRLGLAVRLRVDGVLGDILPPPRAIQEAVLSRIKLMAGLDIAERRLPQDGRIRIRLEDRELDLRAASIPNHFGESVTLRLLDRGGRPVGLDDLGMPPDVLEAFHAAAMRPHGIVLATGPTGCGKTSTLYAALGLRDRATEKVITVEDPVEYELEGVTQVPVRDSIGLTFDRALKALVRLDPDVLMIGEMRDRPSAEIAVRSAMTGHLVFSTLHTNDALGAVPRLSDLGIEAYLVAATLEAVLAQRLVRRVCADCRTRYRPEPRAIALLTGRPIGTQWLERGSGCAGCRGTGYRGRTGIFELLSVTEELKDALSRGADSPELKVLAKAAGMRTLRQDGWAKIEAGITTVEEVLRVVPI